MHLKSSFFQGYLTFTFMNMFIIHDDLHKCEKVGQLGFPAKRNFKMQLNVKTVELTPLNLPVPKIVSKSLYINNKKYIRQSPHCTFIGILVMISLCSWKLESSWSLCPLDVWLMIENHVLPKIVFCKNSFDP